MAGRAPFPARPGGGAALVRVRRRLNGRHALSLILIAAVLWSVLSADWTSGLIHGGGWAALGDIVSGFARPDLSGETLTTAAEAAWITVVYAVAGLSLALVMAAPLALLASGTLLRHQRARLWGIRLGRTVLSLLRAVHELVWAWLFVAAIGLSPFAAIFALAIPYAGILGRIYADFLADVPEAPLRALRSGGAGESAVLAYGRLPSAVADLASYTFYRFECGLRSAAIMGFVGLSGLGFQIQLSLDDLNYQRAATFLFVLIGLIALVELWSTQLRRRLVRGVDRGQGIGS